MPAADSRTAVRWAKRPIGRRNWRLGAWMVAAMALGGHPARAQESDEPPKRAQDLFETGRSLMAAGKLDEACPAFEESMRLDPAGGTLLNLALCHEMQGKTATAWREYTVALRQAVDDARSDREQFARERLAALQPRIPRLLFVIEHPVDGLVIRVDGMEVPPSEHGRPLPIDPGIRTVEVRAPGKSPTKLQVSVGSDESGLVTVRVPSLLPLPILPANTPPQCAANEEWDGGRCAPRPQRPRRATVIPRAASKPAPPEGGRLTGWHYVGYGVGAAGLVLTVVAGLRANAAARDAEDGCIPEREYCSPDGRDAASSARTWAWISSVALGASAGGFVLAVALPRARDTSRSVAIAPRPSAEGMVISGSVPF